MRNADVKALNEGISRLCERRPNCRFVALASHLSDARGFFDRRFAEDDGVHLNAAGYEVWHGLLRTALSQLDVPVVRP